MYGKDRNLLIDCLRGFSILVVLASHGALMAAPPNIGAVISPLQKGYFGVAIFFATSGFLITRNTLKRYGGLAQIQIGQFYIMRIARILPCLLLFLMAMTLLFWFGVEAFVPADPMLIAKGIWSAIIFQYNNFYLSAGNIPGMFAWSPLWSLSIEETFYLSFPIACLISRKQTVFAIGLLALIAYGPFVRMEHFGFYRYFGNADLLSFGCLAAILERKLYTSIGPNLAAALCTAGALAALATFIFIPVGPDYFWAPSIVGIGAAVFLIGSTSLAELKPWRVISAVTTALAAFGRASYEIYLFHLALIVAFRAALPLVFGASWQPQMGPFVGVGVTAIFLAVVLAFATIVSSFFTEPLNQAIRKAGWLVTARLKILPEAA